MCRVKGALLVVVTVFWADIHVLVLALPRYIAKNVKLEGIFFGAVELCVSAIGAPLHVLDAIR